MLASDVAATKGRGVKVAVVHDWFVSYAGSERVVEQILRLFPAADVFCLMDFLPDEQRDFLSGRRICTSFLQKLPFARTKYRSYLPLMPLAIEQFDLTSYDLVISQNHAVGKGVIVGPDQLHVSYVNSPMRYAWDMQHQYLRDSGLDHGLKGWLARWLLHKLRLWDARAANGVDQFVANSRYVARRIAKAYRRDSVVIYPPVDVDYFTLCESKEDYYVAAGRLVPYKRADLLVDAFNAMPNRKLVIIGDGPESSRLKRAAGPNVAFLGYQPPHVLRETLQRARAFVFAAEEDFGIAVVEAQACGTPVIAFARGGASETVRSLGADHPTGVFFSSQSTDAVQDAVERFERHRAAFSPDNCRKNAERFCPDRFRDELSRLIAIQLAAFRSNAPSAALCIAEDGRPAA